KIRWPHLVVILTSGKASEHLHHLPPGVEYIPKPWKAREVLTAAERARASAPGRECNFSLDCYGKAYRRNPRNSAGGPHPSVPGEQAQATNSKSRLPATTRSHMWGQSRGYSITSSARASNVGGISRPSALAVLRLITSSKWVGCSTGRSAGW